MAIGDLPGIPPEYSSRVSALIRKLDDRELSPAEVGGHVLDSVGRVRVDAGGISVTGDFGRIEIGPPEMQAMVEAALNLIDYYPYTKDKELLLKYNGDYVKIRFGLPPKLIQSGVWELDNERLPVIEILDGVKALVCLFAYLNGDLDYVFDMKEKGFKVYRLEEVVGWSVDWPAFAKLMNVAIPLLAVTSKSVAGRLKPPVYLLWDDVLRRCGV